MTLDIQQQILIEQRIQNDAKSPAVAYLLLIFMGFIGAHRFYLGRTASAVTMLVLTVLGIATAVIAIGFIPLAIVGIWTIVDIFLVPGMLRGDKERLRDRLTSQAARAS